MKKKLQGKQKEQLSLEKMKIIQVPDVDFLKSLLSGKFKRLLYLFKKKCYIKSICGRAMKKKEKNLKKYVYDD